MRYLNNPFELQAVRNFRPVGSLGVVDGCLTFSNLKYGVRFALYLMMSVYRKDGVIRPDKLCRNFFRLPFDDFKRFCDYLNYYFPEFSLYADLNTKQDYIRFSNILWNFLELPYTIPVSHQLFIQNVIQEFNLRLWTCNKPSQLLLM